MPATDQLSSLCIVYDKYLLLNKQFSPLVDIKPTTDKCPRFRTLDTGILL